MSFSQRWRRRPILMTGIVVCLLFVPWLRLRPRLQAWHGGLVHRTSLELQAPDGRRRAIDVYWDDLVAIPSSHHIVAYVWTSPLSFAKQRLSVGNRMQLVGVGLHPDADSDQLVLLAQTETGHLFETYYALKGQKLRRIRVVRREESKPRLPPRPPPPEAPGD